MSIIHRPLYQNLRSSRPIRIEIGRDNQPNGGSRPRYALLTAVMIEASDTAVAELSIVATYCRPYRFNSLTRGVARPGGKRAATLPPGIVEKYESRFVVYYHPFGGKLADPIHGNDIF